RDWSSDVCSSDLLADVEPAEDPEPAGETEQAALREHAEVLAVGGVLVARRGGLDVREVAGSDAARLLGDELQDVLPDGQALRGSLQRRAADLGPAAAEPLDGELLELVVEDADDAEEGAAEDEDRAELLGLPEAGVG